MKLPRMLVARALGFSLPTVGFVTALHLVRDATAGEALDGVVSGLWFSIAFLLGELQCARASGGTARSAPAAHEVLAGLSAAVLAWSLLWLFWELPQTESLRHRSNWAFAINSAAMVVAALALAYARPLNGGRRRAA